MGEGVPVLRPPQKRTGVHEENPNWLFSDKRIIYLRFQHFREVRCKRKATLTHRFAVPPPPQRGGGISFDVNGQKYQSKRDSWKIGLLVSITGNVPFLAP